MLAACAAVLVALAPATAPGSPAAPPPASAGAAAALAARVQTFYERTHDLEARFTQTYTYSGFGRRQVSAGTLKVKKPGRMRWDYDTPEPKTIAVVGKRLVQYEPEEQQAYVDEAFDASAMSAAVTFLLGQGELAKEFDLSLEGAGALLMRPKVSDPRVESIVLTVGPEGEVTGTRVLDGGGNVNELRFAKVRRNQGLKDSAFDVKLPKNVRRVAPPGK